ncbi:GNAT family N-acetyltransferase [Viridibacillus arvi]|uniref:GNAT family N-acetyltransferase n=1 Tax=Viridibacillus arvi TaxID=263475 RepID=UPI00187B780A|nr:GNAT family N-acetyltransferase [Viridibacillus sp. JNUCC-6]QOV12327.1 GNAT family N-acetyltransferase [Viridibacillus sp. JNUCC-6]
MKLIEIDKSNWLNVVFLTTNKESMPTLCEEFVASNALSIVQAQFEKTWITKAIEMDGQLIGFTMYGFSEEQNFFELCRIMIDRKFQGNGYGPKAILLVVEEMKKLEGCNEIYLSTEPNNERGKRIYEKLGFENTGRIVENEELYCLKL